MEFQLRMAVQRSQSGLHAWAIVRVRLIEVGSIDRGWVPFGPGFFQTFLLLLLKTDSVKSSSNTCKNYVLKIYSQHGNFLNAI